MGASPKKKQPTTHKQQPWCVCAGGWGAKHVSLAKPFLVSQCWTLSWCCSNWPFRVGQCFMDQEDNGNGTEAIAVVRQENGKCYMAVDIDMKQCGYCGASLPKICLGHRRKQCAGCKGERYCNAACQMEHWPFHWQHCLKNKRTKHE